MYFELFFLLICLVGTVLHGRSVMHALTRRRFYAHFRYVGGIADYKENKSRFYTMLTLCAVVFFICMLISLVLLVRLLG